MAQHQENTLTMGTFLLDELEFGVDILKQREVLGMMPVTRVPCATDFIEGVINPRGVIIPIINLRTRFGMPRKEFSKVTRILNIEVTDKLVVGFIVDAVGQVRRIDRSLIEPPPAVVLPVTQPARPAIATVRTAMQRKRLNILFLLYKIKFPIMENGHAHIALKNKLGNLASI